MSKGQCSHTSQRISQQWLKTARSHSARSFVDALLIFPQIIVIWAVTCTSCPIADSPHSQTTTKRQLHGTCSLALQIMLTNTHTHAHTRTRTQAHVLPHMYMHTHTCTSTHTLHIYLNLLTYPVTSAHFTEQVQEQFQTTMDFVLLTLHYVLLLAHSWSGLLEFRT